MKKVTEALNKVFCRRVRRAGGEFLIVEQPGHVVVVRIAASGSTPYTQGVSE